MNESVIQVLAHRTAPSRYVSGRRLQEILVLQGTPLLGAIIALRHLAFEQAGPLAILMAANLCLVTHIFVLNDWSNVTEDLADVNRAPDVFTARGVGRQEMGVLAGGLLTVSLLLFAALGSTSLFLALGIAALSALYSLPRFNWKGRPLFNSATHIAGGVLHFLVGYSLGGALDRRGLVTACFCGVTFAAGHLTQELRDHCGDMRNAIRTNAVAFGKRRTFIASLGLFALAQTILLVLALDGTLPRPIAALVLLYPLHLRWSLQALRDGLSYHSICRLQARYRALYAVVGIVLTTALWLEWR